MKIVTQVIGWKRGENVVDTQYLEEKIKSSGKKKSYLAEKLGCSRSYLFKKINNQAEFDLSEMKILCKELDIRTSADRDRIFFAH